MFVTSSSNSTFWGLVFIKTPREPDSKYWVWIQAVDTKNEQWTKRYVVLTSVSVHLTSISAWCNFLIHSPNEWLKDEQETDQLRSPGQELWQHPKGIWDHRRILAQEGRDVYTKFLYRGIKESKKENGDFIFEFQIYQINN